MIYKGAELYNVQEMIATDGQEGFLLSRVSETVRINLNMEAQKRAYNTCGCEIRFQLRGEWAKIRLRREPGSGSKASCAEIFYGSFMGPYMVSPVIIGEEELTITVKTPEKLPLLIEIAKKERHLFDPRLLRIILPYEWTHRLLSIEGDIYPPEPDQVPTRKYLAYGSSITHGGSAVTPTQSYAMRTAHLCQADLLNLGFAGSAELDEAMADYIAQRADWDFASLELGVNVVSKWTPHQFEKKVDYFLETIAQRNRDKWIFVIDMFSMDRDMLGNENAVEFRRIIREKVRKMGQSKLKHFDGRELLPNYSGLSADLVHPAPPGMEEIAQNLANRINNFISK